MANLSPVICTGIAEWFSKLKDDFVLNFIEEDRWKLLLSGLGVTLEVAFFSVLVGIVIGIVVAAVRSSYDRMAGEIRNGFLRFIFRITNAVCKIYLTVVRGTPVLIQVLIAFFVIFRASNAKVLIGVLAFGFNSGAYVAEIFRGGIMAVDQGQFEAGRSLGFGYLRTMWYIILPQALKNALPSLANEFIVMLKETSIVGYIALEDLTKAGNIIRGRTYSDFMPLIAVAVIYLVVVLILTKLVSLLERRLRAGER